MSVQISHDLVEQRLRGLRGPPQVYVLRAPPGSGKTQAVIRALAKLRDEGVYKRVLYATHATVKEGAVGREIQSSFRRVVGTPPPIIKGEEHLTPDEYRRQFIRTWRQGIKIIAHAHLKTVFSQRGSLAADHLRRADLLVVDEDPLTSLIIRSSEDFGQLSELRCANLHRLDVPDPMTQAIVNLWQDVVEGVSFPGVMAWNSKRDDSAPPDQHSLTGEALWEELIRRVQSPDWTALENTLFSINDRLVRQGRDERLPVSLLVDTLKEDWAQAQQGLFSQRFGLFWENSPADATFRFDVRVPIDLPYPVLVLDAYADQALYEALFHLHQVTFIHDFDEVLPLHIEVVQDKPFNRRDFDNPTKWHRKPAQIARKVAEAVKGSQRKVLVLAPKRFNEQSHPWKQALTGVLMAHGALNRVEDAHWWAGRGKNAWLGHHVVALLPPHLPRTYREHDLAALFPYDPEARKRAKRHIEQSELLQMLHRGRQPHHDPDDRPRIITFFEPDLPPDHWVRVPHRSNVTLRKHKQLDGWHDAVRTVSEELLEAFGCVPVVALETLGLLKFRNADTAWQDRLKSNLQKAIPRSAGLELRHWKHTGHLMRFRVAEDNGVVPLRGNGRDPLYTVLEAQGLRRLSPFRVNVKGEGGNAGIVFVPPETSQQEVVPLLTRLLAGTSTSSGQPSAASRNNSVGNQRECV